MKKPLLLFALVAIMFAACSGQKKSGDSSLRFKTITIEDELKNPADETDVNSFSFGICFTYPDDFGDKQVLELLRQNFIEHTFGPNPEKLSVDDAVARFIDSKKAEYLKDIGKEGSMTRTLEISDSILYVSDELL